MVKLSMTVRMPSGHDIVRQFEAPDLTEAFIFLASVSRMADEDYGPQTEGSVDVVISQPDPLTTALKSGFRAPAVKEVQ